jgi:hypothetical protein
MKRPSIQSAWHYTFLIVLFAAAISEGIGLLILYQTGTPRTALVLIDSALIVVLLLPVLYAFVYRPIDAYIKKIRELDAEKEKTIEELKSALAEIKTLKGIIPICASCKKIRDDRGYWNQIESYIHEHSEADFSHGICPECEKLYARSDDDDAADEDDAGEPVK